MDTIENGVVKVDEYCAQLVLLRKGEITKALSVTNRKAAKVLHSLSATQTSGSLQCRNVSQNRQPRRVAQVRDIYCRA